MWMNTDDIVLNEISQSQKDKRCKFHVCKVPRVINFTQKNSGFLGERK
jgi:hypothetical protein